MWSMKTAPDSILSNVEIPSQQIDGLLEKPSKNEQQINYWKREYQQLLDQFRLAQQRHYGKSSEVNPDQIKLFNEVVQTDEPALSEGEDELETILYIRKKSKRKELPNHLPREIRFHDLAEHEKCCDCYGHDLHVMGEEKSAQLKFIPAQAKVIENIRPKYGCRRCEQEGNGVNIKIAPAPSTQIPRSFATASLLSQIIISKNLYALPLYRQECMFKQYGIE